MTEIENKWNVITELHTHAKKLLLTAEELDVQLETFHQTLQEEKYISDHAIRVKYAEFHPEAFPTPGEREKYIIINLDKAIGHAYRAYFDTADWFSIIIRERIIEILVPYSRKTILAVIPNYYSEIRPKIDIISINIADMRAKKDIANIQILDIVEKYDAEMYNLIDIIIEIQSKIGALEEYKSKGKWERIRYWLLVLIVAVISTVGGGLIVNKLCSYKTQSVKPKTQVIKTTDKNSTLKALPPGVK